MSTHRIFPSPVLRRAAQSTRRTLAGAEAVWIRFFFFSLFLFILAGFGDFRFSEFEKLRIWHFLFESSRLVPTLLRLAVLRAGKNWGDGPSRRLSPHPPGDGGEVTEEEEGGARACVLLCVLLQPHELDPRAPVAVRNKRVGIECVKDGQRQPARLHGHPCCSRNQLH